MAQASDREAILYQNLLDTGCDPKTIEQCMALAQGEKTSELLRLLSCHRKALLAAVHRSQQQIDRLDYLVYKTEKEQRLEE